MGVPVSPERARARRLVVEEGYTLAEAAEAVGISLSALQKASAEEKWQEQRKHHAALSQSYHANVRRLKVRLLELATLAVEQRHARLLGHPVPQAGATETDTPADNRPGSGSGSNRQADAELLNADELLKSWRAIETSFPERHYQPPEDDPGARRRAYLECLELLIAYATEQDRNLLAALQPHLHQLGRRIDEVTRGGE